MIAMFKKRKKNHSSWKMKALSHLWEKRESFCSHGFIEYILYVLVVSRAGRQPVMELQLSFGRLQSHPAQYQFLP